MAKIDNLFHLLHANHGSDLHLSAGNPPLLRIYGDLARVDAPVVTTEELLAVLREMVPMERVQAFEQTGDLDFAYEIPGLARYRANFFRQNRGISAVFREIPQRISTVEELGLPIMLRELALLPKGLVLVTGPTGSGKSTTLAALVDYANTKRRDHIITIEDPIEFVHQSKSCLVNQREIGRDSRSFGTALRSALREDPDIILVGEMRDLETISLALEAAETGHLVFATLHTISAPKTIDRIIEVFPPEEQAQIRTSLSESIQAIIVQTGRQEGPGTRAGNHVRHPVRAEHDPREQDIPIAERFADQSQCWDADDGRRHRTPASAAHHRARGGPRPRTGQGASP